MTVILIAMALSVLFTSMTAAAARGLLKNNGAIGIRTRATMRNQGAWQRGHASALPVTLITSALVVVTGATILLSDWQADSAETAGGALIGITIVGLLVAALIANRSAKQDM